MREKRDSLGYSLPKLSRLTHINKGRLSLIERGIYWPSEVEWKALQDVIGEITMEIAVELSPRSGK